MSEEVKKPEEKVEKEREDIVLTITLQKDGKTMVSGPGNGTMYDEPLCFWMLEKAKDFIKVTNARLMQPKITPVHGGRLNWLRRRGGIAG